jgi:LuxR family transcriptional regulator, activator of conjugal transfer of Ti plasmids
MRWQDYLDIGLAPDRATFRRRMIDFAHWMDFPIVGVVLMTEGRAGSLDARYIGNRPLDFVAGSDPHLLKADPVVSQLRRGGDPFPYDQQYYVDAGVPQLWENAAPYGYRTGISASLQISPNQRVLVGLDRERRLPKDRRRLDARLTDLARFAALAANGAQRFAATSHRPSATASLSTRECEILLRVLEGKSNWAIARLLNVSENTVKFHLKNIFRKLDVSSRVVAATKAHSLGLL